VPDDIGALLDTAVTLRHLLTHTSGLPAGRTFHRWCGSREELLADLCRTPLAAPPGARVVYSDLGFIALGEVVAAVAGPLHEAVRSQVTGPLGLTMTNGTLGSIEA
jgi:CubicO group peptidase (beta-lactamase class C family)